MEISGLAKSTQEYLNLLDVNVGEVGKIALQDAEPDDVFKNARHLQDRIISFLRSVSGKNLSIFRFMHQSRSTL